MFHKAPKVKVYFAIFALYTAGMSNIGKFFEYNKESNGKFYSKLPNLPYSTPPEYFATIHSHIMGLSLSKIQAIREMSPIERMKYESVKQKKYILFCVDEQLVEHQHHKTISCMYLKCMVTDPYTEELKTVWVRSGWLEPFNANTNYENQVEKTLKIIHQFKTKEDTVKEDPATMAQQMRSLTRLYRQV